MKLFKKKKAKGFTLVELIVVMAIIGVLAAVLIPQMVGFMRDARISRANQNAAAIHTAATAALTQYVIANGTADTGDFVFSADVDSGTLVLTHGTTDIDLANYMNPATFQGSCLIVTAASGDSILYTLWSDTVDLTAITDPGDAATANPDDIDDQIDASNNNTLVGAYPAPQA